MVEFYIKYLFEKLGVPIYAEVPDALEKENVFVVIDKIGSSKTNMINQTTLAFQSYADSKYNASKLNDRVIGAVESSIEENEISSAKLDSDYNFTNTSIKKHRFQAVFRITHY